MPKRVQVDSTPMINQLGGFSAGTRATGTWLDLDDGWTPAGVHLTITLNTATVALIDFDVRPYGETVKAYRVRALNGSGDFAGIITVDGDYYFPLTMPGGVPIVAHQVRIGVTFDVAPSASTYAHARLVKTQG